MCCQFIDVSLTPLFEQVAGGQLVSTEYHLADECSEENIIQTNDHITSRVLQLDMKKCSLVRSQPHYFQVTSICGLNNMKKAK